MLGCSLEELDSTGVHFCGVLLLQVKASIGKIGELVVLLSVCCWFLRMRGIFVYSAAFLNHVLKFGFQAL